MKMKRLWAVVASALLVLATGGDGYAQGSPSNHSVVLVSDYDLDSTDLIYPITVGRDLTVLGESFIVTEKVTTSGSASTTLTAVDATNQDPFAQVVAGDELEFIIPPNGTFERRYVVSKASDDEITINANITIAAAGVGFRYRKRDLDENGWIPVRQFANWSFWIEVDQLVDGGAGVVTSLQCKPAGTVEITNELATDTIAAATFPGNSKLYYSDGSFPADYCRLGIKLDTADDGDDLTTNAEKITVGFVGRRE
jgi:hypothetical protein